MVGEPLFIEILFCIMILLFIIVPLATIISLIVNMVRYIKTPVEEKKLKERRKKALIVNSSILVTILLLALIILNDLLIYEVAIAGIFVLIPGLLLAWVIVSAVRYKKAVEDRSLKMKRIIVLIVASVITLVIYALLIALAIYLNKPLEHM